MVCYNPKDPVRCMIFNNHDYLSLGPLKNWTCYCFSIFFLNTAGDEAWLNYRYWFPCIASVAEMSTLWCWIAQLCSPHSYNLLISTSQTGASQIAPFHTVRSLWQHIWCNFNRNISTCWNVLFFFFSFQSATADHCVKQSVYKVLLSHSVFLLCFLCLLLGLLAIWYSDVVDKNFLC